MKMYVNTDNNGTLNLRDVVNGKRILTRIPNGTELEVESTETGWYKTSYNGIEGYVMAKFLAAKSPTVSRDQLQKIYNSLEATLKTIKEVLN